MSREEIAGMFGLSDLKQTRVFEPHATSSRVRFKEKYLA